MNTFLVMPLLVLSLLASLADLFAGISMISEVPKELPEAVSLEVPFTAQAPDGDWSMPYQEACEEAVIIMAKAYLDGEDLSEAEADR